MNDLLLDVRTIVTQPFAENTYLARLDARQDCLVFDPGLEADKILDRLDRLGWTPAAIVNTHGHVDHIAGNGALKARWPDCPLVIGAGDAALLTDPMLNLSGLYGFGFVSPPADRLLREGELFEAAGIALRVLEIPGHSPGHVVLVWESGDDCRVFGGDVLFAGSVGRTDFPGGSFRTLAQGIREKLFRLPDSTLVYPGHGPTTTIGDERANNPFVGDAARIE